MPGPTAALVRPPFVRGMRMSSARVVVAIIMAGSLAACGRAPGVYDLSVREAYERLAAAPLDDFKLARQCGILIHLMPQAVPNQSVSWHVYSGGIPLLDFTARLTPVGEKQTKVDIEISKDPDGTEAYAGNDFYPRPAFHQPLRPGVEEAVAAVLEGRPYDVWRVPKGGDVESVCNVQRAGLEAGHRFSIHDTEMDRFSQ